MLPKRFLISRAAGPAATWRQEACAFRPGKSRTPNAIAEIFDIGLSLSFGEDRAPVRVMKKLILVSFITTAAMFAQVQSQTSSQSTESNSTTVLKDDGKKSYTSSNTTTTNANPAGTTTDSHSSVTTTKKKHGKYVKKTNSSDSSSATPNN
jgi:hypothetical protein